MEVIANPQLIHGQFAAEPHIICGFDARGRAELFPPEACYSHDSLQLRVAMMV